jgi:hypothetical protein
MLRITAPHFVAAVILDASRQRVERTAPILSYMRAWTPAKIADYCKRKGWQLEEL